MIDIHNPAGAGQADGHDKAVTGGARRVKPYDIPYGALVPKKVDGLLFCGRCLSASHEALASCRVMGRARRPRRPSKRESTSARWTRENSIFSNNL